MRMTKGLVINIMERTMRKRRSTQSPIFHLVLAYKTPIEYGKLQNVA